MAADPIPDFDGDGTAVRRLPVKAYFRKGLDDQVSLGVKIASQFIYPYLFSTPGKIIFG